MITSPLELKLSGDLRSHPSKFNTRYTEDARGDLLRILFTSLANQNEEYLHLLFPTGHPADITPAWNLSEAQGAVDGAEYTEAARGNPCGHIIRDGEAIYSCRTCSQDDTCVLCAKCFDASDHDDHQVSVSWSPSGSGCCDCGDTEAWVRPVHCSIHSPLSETESKAVGKARELPQLPEDLAASIQMTIGRALNYLCDVFSCSLEQSRLPRDDSSIRENEEFSRLKSKLYGAADENDLEPEYALILWNDEKHTVPEVEVSVAKACKRTISFGHAKALEIDDIGRSVIEYSHDLNDLLRKARIIEQIKVVVTIRSARDTYREQMCGTIIEWLGDIAGCSVGQDHQILRRTVCEEMLKPWRIGSEAINMDIGRQGIPDHAYSDDHDLRLQSRSYRRQLLLLRAEREQMILEEQQNRTAGQGTDGQTPAHLWGLMTRMVAEGILTNTDVTEVTQQEAADDNDEDDDDDVMDLDEALAMDNEAEEGRPMSMVDVSIAGADTTTLNNPQNRTSDDSEDEEMTLLAEPLRDPDKAFTRIPRTPQKLKIPHRAPAPPHWITTSATSQEVRTRDSSNLKEALTIREASKSGKKLKPEHQTQPSIPIHEDLNRRVRLDFLILYDLRMWKRLRNELRDLYISTVVNIPSFKRILGLRFTSLYTALAELYLIADREPDLSVINLSLQMLTTPSITAEIVERGNFLTTLLAILYTFSTTRQVGPPKDVDPNVTLAIDGGAATNRRILHFFSDMRYLLCCNLVQEKIRNEERFLLQFLDYTKLYQGICPNIRAVGEHIEYESDTWISVSAVVAHITRMCRQFSESFTWKQGENAESICRAIRQTAKVTIVNAIGAEVLRFHQSDIVKEVEFRDEGPFASDLTTNHQQANTYSIIKCEIDKEPMSFHHVLHYILSWLIDCGKSMSADQLRSLMTFNKRRLEDFRHSERHVDVQKIPDLQSEQYLLALFDIPLRVCAWMAQMKSGMWVRNGITLRHQMQQYRSVNQRDVSHQRDLFLMQTAFIVCDPTTYLVSVIDRFGLLEWAKGHFVMNADQVEDSQMVDVAEDLFHLLIILLSDRTALIPTDNDINSRVATIRRDIINVLCFKPLPNSEMMQRLPDKFADYDEFQQTMEELTTFKAPEGLQDSGTFELKSQYLEEVDPYFAYYNKNQREEAENIYRAHMAKTSSKSLDDVVYEPRLQEIKSGLFMALGAFTQTSFFAQFVFSCFKFALSWTIHTPKLPATRIEAFLGTLLHLTLLAILEDKTEESSLFGQPKPSFISMAIDRRPSNNISREQSIMEQLQAVSGSEIFKPCGPKVRLLLRRMQQRRPAQFLSGLQAMGLPIERMDTSSPAGDINQDATEKKKQALERQARVFAQMKKQQNEFLDNQTIDWGVDDMSDDDSLGEVEPGSPTRTFVFPSGTCIFCQEDTNDQKLYGTLAYINETNLLRQTDLDDEDYIAEALTSPISFDRSAEDIRPFGVSSKNVEHITKFLQNGKRVMAERHKLGKGFPPYCRTPGAITSSCGHLMHWACFDTYNAATRRRHQYQVARNHAERLNRLEFVCPLCKAIGNMFLPIVWKPKHLFGPSRLQSSYTMTSWLDGSSFIDLFPFLQSRLRDSDATSAYAPRPSGNGKSIRVEALAEPESSNYQRSDALLSREAGIGIDEMIGPYFSRRRSEVMNNFVSTGSHSTGTPELVIAYRNFSEAIKANKLESLFADHGSVDGFVALDMLVKALGFTISATEIAQRGIGSTLDPTLTFMENVPSQLVTYLCIVSESIKSFAQVGGLGFQAQRRGEELIGLLFAGHPGTRHLPPSMTPLLCQDVFMFFNDVCIYHPVETAEAYDVHLLQICYLAEITKVVLGFLLNPRTLWNYAATNHSDITPSGLHAEQTKADCNSQESENFSTFVQSILADIPDSLTYDGSESLRNPNDRYRFDRLLRAAVLSYSLPFLRKALLLFHFRLSIDFSVPSSLDPSAPELARLSATLNVPAVDTIIEHAINHPIVRALVSNWVHQAVSTADVYMPPIYLSHPAIYELVALPQTHDTLATAAMSTKCPTTGKDLTDPCLCLLCGAIFCGQASCCARGERQLGGCFQHLEICGGANARLRQQLRQLPAAERPFNLGERKPSRAQQIPQTGFLGNNILTGGSQFPMNTTSSEADNVSAHSSQALHAPLHPTTPNNATHIHNSILHLTNQHSPSSSGAMLFEPFLAPPSSRANEDAGSGIFLNIRKNALLFLHGRHGCFLAAPYLDKYGEVDKGLRRKGQLFLNQRRYDKLVRDVWLAGGVASTVARSLEAEIGSGGWETL